MPLVPARAKYGSAGERIGLSLFIGFAGKALREPRGMFGLPTPRIPRQRDRLAVCWERASDSRRWFHDFVMERSGSVDQWSKERWERLMELGPILRYELIRTAR